MVSDSTLQIILTAYYGSELSSFLFESVVQGGVLFYYDHGWMFFLTFLTGIIFFMASLVSIKLIWSKTKNSLIISLLILIFFIIWKNAFGIPLLIKEEPFFGVYEAQQIAIFVIEDLLNALAIFFIVLLLLKTQ
jgi:hypothetical protein